MIQSICHLIASREHGGMEKHVADLSRWQAHNTGARVSVIAHPRYRATLDESVDPLNTDRSRHHPTLIWRLANQIRAGEYQIAHGHGSKSAQLLVGVQKYTDARQVITRHNVRHPRDKLASAFSARIAVSHTAVANSRLSWNIIPNGVDTAVRPATPVEFPVAAGSTLLVAARLVKLKGVDLLLQAMPELPDTQLIILGEGPEKENLQKLSDSLLLGGRVNFIGYSDQVSAFMRAADLLVMPSRNEGAPYTLIEALLNHCPVVASRVGNAGEYIPNQYLLDDREPAHLAQKLHTALQDKQRLQRDFAPVFARAGRELTLDNMARATWQVYAQLVSQCASSF
ncbi:glycosyltransferase family 4 protein [Microbulbifer rhizosphaerae]|uniref:Glycosyltransferase involved in cell wall biosynthesis n=1 Tax=Microbulbifer rhizosphaerae TaxID=1562603 RepID=A0A7W4W9W2_9GAMM|nr:glycosyltransferase family 4 protein [Microbulbifer rhizosphaerae]MBB3060378.1 glycosyltransferase involved in cell wall biosynthesis [Microbulbifer rhizosphaerae]